VNRRDSHFRSFFLLTGLLLALGSCARVVPRPHETPVPPAAPANALEAGVREGPPVERLAITPEAAQRALDAFVISCPSLARRQDASGLTIADDWTSVCVTARNWHRDAGLFFAENFVAFATGYYEPEIAGSRTRQPGYDVPIYSRPPDLLDANPQTGERGKGRIDEIGAYVLYHDRAAIEAGALAGRGLEIAWAADPVDLFFLQIQGSGRLRLPDGSVMRIGFSAQNGRDYVAIGRLLRDRGLVPPPVSMQAIRDWIHANPDAGAALMRENPSYVFFRELTGPGPLGALGLPVTPAVSIAADPRFVPLGAPVFLQDMDNARADGLWVAQDTGGAIRGANRVDTFWGAGADAAAIAGAMQAHGRAWLLLPRATLFRVGSFSAPAQR
jgi:membrane-bound lytic murein transglycosylase A